MSHARCSSAKTAQDTIDEMPDVEVFASLFAIDPVN
jgi:hypothetical protein